MSSIRDEFKKTVADRRKKMEESGAAAALKCLADTITQLAEAGIDISLAQDSEGRLNAPRTGYSFSESSGMPRYLLTVEGSSTYGLYFGRSKDDGYSTVTKFGMTNGPLTESNRSDSPYCKEIDVTPEKLRRHLIQLAATYHICNEALPGSNTKNTPANMVRKFKHGG